MLNVLIFSVLCCSTLFVHGDTLIKVDCHPDLNADQNSCITRGCIWSPPTNKLEPSCYFDPNNFAGYDVTSMGSSSSGLFANLTRINTPSIFGGDEVEIALKVVYQSESRVEISFNSVPTAKRQLNNRARKLWEQTIKKSSPSKFAVVPTNLQYEVQIQQTPHFGLKVVRKLTGTVIFDTTNIPGFTVADQFLSITTRTPTTNVYGFGEQVHRKFKHSMNWERWGMFARDTPSIGTPMNLYGVHPFYVCLENDGRAHGVALMNSFAQSIELAPYPTITYRTIGGSLDFNIFLGPTPDNVVQQYTTVIGKPFMPPMWALGFHLCRWGYKNTSEVQAVWKRNNQAGIPQDAQWIDIDYMNSFYDFTYDPVNFQTLPAFVDTLHSQNLHLVLITDPGIPSNPTIDYPPLTSGLASNVFITDATTSQPIQGSVWPGNVYFPDFSNPKTETWWQNQIATFIKSVPFDGLWIDMNEPSNFVTGSTHGCMNNSLNSPPFVPLFDPTIVDKTLCMDAQQYSGNHYELHNMFGLLEAKATNKALLKVTNERPFVLSRSTFMGSGAYAAHWLGDNESKWPDMAWSIITCMEFNLFGIPFVGADICGFSGNTTEELCLRWHQLGAFYPFSRNHNHLSSIDQDPAVWSPNTVQAIKKVLTTRYKFIPYLYTLMMQAAINGSTVMRPLFFEFSRDPNTYDIDDQFLWGSSLMIVPILTENTTSRSAYFPAGRWFDANTGAEVSNSITGHFLNLTIGLYDIGLYSRGGSIIPWQVPGQTTSPISGDFGLIVSLDDSQYASGFWFFDDGTYPDDEFGGYSGYDTFDLIAYLRGNQYGMLVIKPTYMNIGDADVVLNTVQVFGIFAQPSSAAINSNPINNSSQLNYDSINKVFTLTGLNIRYAEFSTNPMTIRWNFF